MSDHIYIDGTTRLRVTDFSEARQVNIGGKSFLELCPVEVTSQTLQVVTRKRDKIVLVNPDSIMAVVLQADQDVIE